jgi:hypothetical protein
MESSFASSFAAGCWLASISQYKQAVTKLMEEVIGWHSSRGWPLVKLWGAWNEPDAANDPLHEDAPRAAQFWEVANSILHKITPHYPCGGCASVAGEFSTYYLDYTTCYRNIILYSYCHGPHNRYTRYWFGEPRDPTVWGFHDYKDLENRNNNVARDFAHFARDRLHKPRLFMSEAGVLLQNEETATELAAEPELQRKAAEEFLKLPSGLPYPIDRMYYYEYTAPSKAGQEEHKFDSALLEVENGLVHERPAYCVLAYSEHLCPPIIESIEQKTEIGGGLKICGPLPPSVEFAARVNPEGAKSLSFDFEYGPTTSNDGKPTASQTVPVRNSAQSVEIHGNVPLAGAPLNEHLCPILHYKLVVSNGAAHRSVDELVAWGVII